MKEFLVVNWEHSCKLLRFLRKLRTCVRILATDRQTNRWTASMRKGVLVVASGALTSVIIIIIIIIIIISFNTHDNHTCIQLPDSFRQPHPSCLDSPPHPLVNPSLSSSLLSFPSLFHSRLKTYLLNKSFPPWTSFTYWTAFVVDWTGSITFISFSFTF